jgi:hypothetical protein
MKGHEMLVNFFNDPDEGEILGTFMSVLPAKLWKTRVVSELYYLKNKNYL